MVGLPLGDDVHVPLKMLLRKRGRIIGTNLRHRPLPAKAQAVQRFEHEVTPLLNAGLVTPFVEGIYPAREAPAAFTHLAGSGKRGKVLLDLVA